MKIDNDAIINKAIRNTPYPININARDVLLAPNSRFDALLSVNLTGIEIPFVAQIEKEVKSTKQVITFVNKVKKPLQPMIVADKITNAAKEQLRSKLISFITGEGDFFIPIGNFEDHHPQKKIDVRKVNINRIHGMPFVKLGFALARIKIASELNTTELSEKLDISLGSISKILNNWRKSNLIESRGGAWKITNIEEFTKRWATAYIDQVKHHESLFLGSYKSNLEVFNINSIKSMKPPNDGWWGGESGASLITNDLAPEKFTLYSGKSLKKIISQLFLQRSDEGNIRIYKAFWTAFDDMIQEQRYCAADPMVIYADLCFSRSVRLQDSAKSILKGIVDDYR